MIDPTAHPDEHTEIDDLLAAYLDNELSDTERATVDSRLAADDAFRARLDELDQQTKTDSLLAAYLDNELSDGERARVETRLAEDDTFRNRLDELDRTWDMLETLPKADLDDEKFVRTTVEMITIQASQEIEQYKKQQHHSALARQLSVALGVVVLVGAGYLTTQWVLTRPDRVLVDNLPVVEHLDEFEQIEDIKFLELLKHEGLFTGENSNES